MKTKKTVPVANLIVKLNGILQSYHEGMVNVQEINGIRNFVEDIMMDTGNYNGYSYLTINEVPAGERPGIQMNGFGAEELFEDTDHNRVLYYI